MTVVVRNLSQIKNPTWGGCLFHVRVLYDMSCSIVHGIHTSVHNKNGLQYLELEYE